MITSKQVVGALFGTLMLPFFNATAKAEIKADFTASIQKGTAPLMVKFTDASKGKPTSWKWDLGNGHFSFKQNPVSSYALPGKYQIKLVVKNIHGADSVIKTQYIVVEEKPIVVFEASTTSGCFPLEVAFTDNSKTPVGNIIRREWNFGDGTTSTDANPKHTYTTAGSFSVSLTVTNSDGVVKKMVKPALIAIDEGIRADFEVMAKPGCLPVSFVNQSTATGLMNFEWSFSDGATKTDADVDYNFQKSGNYTITLKATNESGCIAKTSKEIAVALTPKANGGYTRKVKVLDASTLLLTRQQTGYNKTLKK